MASSSTLPPSVHAEVALDVAFLSYIDKRELRVARRRDSGEVLHYAVRRAEADVDWLPASGKATLHSFTVFWQAYRKDISVPYNVAWVELEEGPRLITTVMIQDFSRLRIGMALTARFKDDGMLVFELADTV